MDTPGTNEENTTPEATDSEVFIYSTPVCHFCQEAKAFFKENNVNYTEFDVASDAERRQEMIDLTGQMGVPVIRIGEDVVIGFDESKLSELLKL
ncbi:glutaredoxin family protein [Candidatus Kaiserbacteria bacterium]|nr:glutaredoxin family protein [Candidatus Kaiserbacteria bacterium]USN92294.1 MAG: glutaredoxin family protein [Candidatus Nomurabacteria bacterium]